MIDEVKRRAAALWRFRAGVELQASARFARLAEQLEAHAADPVVVGLARRAADDERRHHALCVELAQGFGARSIPHVADPPPPVTLGRTDSSQQLLAEIVAMSCVTESLSTALLIEMRRVATDRRVRDVVHEVLRDEVDHARLGWAHLAAEHGRTRADLGWLAARLPAMLAETVSEELFGEAPPDDAVAEGVAGLGGLTRRSRRDIFVGAMQGVVLPGLARFGVDTGAAAHWLDRKIGSADRSVQSVVVAAGEAVAGL